MAPKKGQKMSLNEFLGDSALGSWADEMDALPTAPAPRADDGYGGRGERDFGGRGGDRGGGFDRFPPREELPLPTQPPYTAFVGNLSFDCTEAELESYFSAYKTKSIKIIADREGKPKGFGYVEFADLDGLKGGLAMDRSSMSGRTIRVNVAEPPKEREGGRSGFGGGDRGSAFDDDKFSGDWRRSGPLPPLEPRSSRFGGGGDDGPRRGSRFEDGPERGSRFEPREPREPRESTQAESNEDWRSNRPARAPAPELSVDMPPGDRPRRSGFPTPTTTGPTSAADSEDKWQIGSKFKPSGPPSSPGPERGGPRPFGVGRGGGPRDGPPRDGPGPRDASVDEPSDWRSGPRRGISQTGGRGGYNDSPSNSTPPTPVLARRKLELTPRSGAPSNVTSPLGSPKAASAQPTTPPAKSNPFGAARPVDVTTREREVAERLEREREREQATRERERETRPRPSGDAPSSSYGGPNAGAGGGTWRRGGPPATGSGPPSRQTSRPASPTLVPATPTSALSPISPRQSANVRPAFSFANAAKSSSGSGKPEQDELAEKTAELSV